MKIQQRYSTVEFNWEEHSSLSPKSVRLTPVQARDVAAQLVNCAEKAETYEPISFEAERLQRVQGGSVAEMP